MLQRLIEKYLEGYGWHLVKSVEHHDYVWTHDKRPLTLFSLEQAIKQQIKFEQEQLNKEYGPNPEASCGHHCRCKKAERPQTSEHVDL
jgi:hypothetical protein